MAKKSARSTKGSKTKPSAFENVKDQLAYCGLWCGSCSVGNGTVNDFAGRCAKVMTDYGIHEWGPRDVDYDIMLSGLAKVCASQPCPGCLKGGGRTNCEIRACAIGKGYAECVDCPSGDACPNSKLILHMRSGARRVGMKVKDESGSRSKILKDWISEMESIE